jgi:hypothetical protein
MQRGNGYEGEKMTAKQVKVDAAQLGRALIEQARLGDAYAHSVGTSAEQSAYERLRHAGATVSACDRRVKQGNGQTERQQ